jgi:DNA-binding transcriptional ArsR family regulator
MLGGVVSKQWTFLSHHAHVLLVLSANPDDTIDTVAVKTGVTSRSVVSILRDLEEAGYITTDKVGRRNRYTINHGGLLRHPTSAHHTVGELIDALGGFSA